VLCNARFNLKEIRRLKLKDMVEERALVSRPIISSLIPGLLLRYGYKKSNAKSIIYVSKAAQERYHNIGLPKGILFQPAVSDFYSNNTKSNTNTQKVICHFGPPLHIRGMDLAIKAFNDAAQYDDKITLKLLVRLNGEKGINKKFINIMELVRCSPYKDKIRIVDKYLSPEELKEELDASDIFLLPFKITVSDAPLVVIEAGLSGKPVITLDTPGVSEFVQEFGGVICENEKLISKAINSAVTRVQSPEKKWTSWKLQAKQLVVEITNESV
jgi:glycosyltransferase involved in cell wall biosynthesis